MFEWPSKLRITEKSILKNISIILPNGANKKQIEVISTNKGFLTAFIHSQSPDRIMDFFSNCFGFEK